MKHIADSRRDGFTLVEMVTTISTASVLFVLAIGMVHRVMQLESTSRERASVERAAVRLSHDFRQDVHRAKRLETVAAEDFLPAIQLTGSDGGEVVYCVTDQGMLRRQGTAREVYDFPAGYQVIFSQTDQQLVGLAVMHDLRSVGHQPRTVVYVEAEVGRVVRLTGAGGNSP